MMMMMMMTVMMCLVAKDSSNPLVLKLTLHSLVSCWEPDLHLITHHHSERDISEASTSLSIRPSVVQLIGRHRELLSFLSVICLLLLSFI